MSYQLLNKTGAAGKTTHIATKGNVKAKISQNTSQTAPQTVATNDPKSLFSTDSSDTRVRLRCMRGQEDQVYGKTDPANNLLSILHPNTGDGTDGLMFPYTPQIAITHKTDYNSVNLTHANEDIDTYVRTPSVGIGLTAKFTVQNQREGRYALAALHFLRVVSKMYFGEQDKANNKAGLPPPILVFSGYGNYMFDNLPVIVLSHSYSFDDSMNMVTVNTAGGSARLPALFQIQMDLKVQQTPTQMRTVFSLDKFRTGELMRSSSGTFGTGWL